MPKLSYIITENLLAALTTAVRWAEPSARRPIFAFADADDELRSRVLDVARTRLAGHLCGTYKEMLGIVDNMPMTFEGKITRGVVIDVDDLPAPVSENLVLILDKLGAMDAVVFVVSTYKHRDLCRSTNAWEMRSLCADFVREDAPEDLAQMESTNPEDE